MLSICFANSQKTRIIQIHPLIESPQISRPHNSSISSCPLSSTRLNYAKPRVFISLLHSLLRNLRDLILSYFKNSISIKLHDSASAVVNLNTSSSNSLNCRLIWKRDSLTLILIPLHYLLHSRLPHLSHLPLLSLFYLLCSTLETLYLRVSGNIISENLSCHTIDYIAWVKYSLSFWLALCICICFCF